MDLIENDEKDIGYSRIDVIPSPPALQARNPSYGEGEFTVEDYRTALRLLVGAALEGSDELRYRLKTWLVSVQKRERGSGVTVLGLEGTGSSRLIYTAIGLLFKTPDVVSRGITAAGRVSRRATSLVSRLTKPVSHSWPLRPVRRRYHALLARWDSVVSPLEETGRSEAHSSRALIRQEVNDEMVEEFLIYLVERSKMRELIAETSAEVGGDALDEARVRSAEVDSSLDNIVNNILRRQKIQTPPTGSSP
jgi:hypothetical protein